MSYQTKDDLLAKWETAETRAEAREIAAIRKDIQTARDYLYDALARYRKAKLRVKSKKMAEENPFADLEPYLTRQQIQDDYGWELISEAEMDRLNALWDLRESGKSANIYKDRVTEMITRAISVVGDEFADTLFEFDMRKKQREKEAERIARENNERTWAREHHVQTEE